MSQERGALALLLHTHMPYVEGFGTWPFGEEWLWEAVATVYLPLLDMLEEAEAPVTVGLTPVLCDQLETLTGAAGDRLRAFLCEVTRTVHEEDSTGLERSGASELAAEVRRAGREYDRAVERLDDRGGDLLAAFARLDAGGAVELWSSTATHALLPMLASDAGRRLQIATGVRSHERRFGRFGGGFWLPECGYEPGLERELSDHGALAFCVDQSAVHGVGAPEQLEPVATEAGVVAVPIDWLSVELVWNRHSGYPSHPSYRDYHRRTVHDRRPWSTAGEPYRPAEARALAAEHARDFVSRCAARLAAHGQARGRAGLLCFAIDTELLGHWWYEGQIWLGLVIEEARAQGLDLVTVSEGVRRVPPVERELAPSTWGADKDLSTWDSPPVAELAFAARGAELRTVAAAARRHEPAAALERAARELMALQASDWAFQVTHELASDYPLRRAAAHAAAHDAALGALTDGAPVPEPAVRNLAPHLALAPLVAP
jgi:1,4-alpha-glucan branching enzyme